MDKIIRSAAEARQQVEREKAVAVLRGDYTGYWLPIADALIEGGLTIIEITLTCPDAYQVIETLRDHCAGRASIGAGTVLTANEVDRSVQVGAEFVVAPNTNADMIRRANELNVMSIPGAYTPTEVEFAHRIGATMVKLFPGMPIGPAYLRNLRGPYPDIPIIVTGGITPEVAPEFLAAGANAIGVTKGLVPPDSEITQPGAIDKIRDTARRVIELISPYR